MASVFDVGSITARLALDTGNFQTNLRNTTRGVGRSTRRMETAFGKWSRRTRSAILGVLNPLRIFRSSLRRTSASVSNFGAKAIRSFRNLRTAVLAFSAAFAGIAFARRAEQAAQGAEAFRNIAISLGTDAPLALEKMRKALRGTVSDLGLMKAVSNAAVLGVGRDIEQMGEIFAAARRLGQATGRSAEEAVQDIVVGIGRQSRLILDNLGLIVKVEKANQKYAASINKVASELTQEETQTAFLLASLEAVKRGVTRLGPEVDTFAVAFQRFGASIHNFITEVSIRVAPSMTALIESFQSLDMTNFRESIIVVMNDTLFAISGWIQKNRSTVTSFFDSLGSALIVTKIALREIAILLTERIQGFLDNPATIGEFIGAQVASVLTTLAGLVQYLSGKLVLGFLEHKETLYDFFTALGNEFLKGVKPLFAMFDEMFSNFATKVITPLRFLLNNIPGINILETDTEKSVRELRQWKEQEVIARKVLEDTKTNILLLQKAIAANINQQPLAQDPVRVMSEVRAPGDGSFSGLSPFRGDDGQQQITYNPGPVMGLESNMIAQASIDVIEELRANLVALEEGLAQAEDNYRDIVEQVALSDTTANNMVEKFSEEQEKFEQGLKEQVSAGQSNIEKGLDGILSNIIGVPFKGFLQALKEELAATRALIAEALLQRQETTALGFRPITTHEELQSITDQLKITGQTAEQIAESFAQGDLSFREVEKSINTLIALHERISNDDRVGFTTQVQSLNELAVLQEQLDAVRTARRIYAQQEKDDADAIVDADKDRATAEKYLLSLIEQRAVVMEGIRNAGLTGDELLKANEDALIAKATRKIDLLTIEKDLREEILAIVRDLAGKTTDLSDAEKAAGNLKALQTGITTALVEGLAGGENKTRNFHRRFAKKFHDELSKVIGTLGDTLGAALGKSLGTAAEKFLSSDAFGAILGLIGILSSRKSGSTNTEEPLEDIITSSTAVRGVVAGPTSVAISEIGSSIKEANRGVESLLTEIRDTLQSIEDSGLTSGGMGQAALT